MTQGTPGIPGTATSGVLGSRNHTYTTAGPKTVTVIVRDDNGGSATHQFTVTIAAPAILNVPTISGFEGTAVELLATATNLDTAVVYSATVAWGDGTTTNAVVTLGWRDA